MRKPVLAVNDQFATADAKHVKHSRLFSWSVSGIYSQESGPNRPVRPQEEEPYLGGTECQRQAYLLPSRPLCSPLEGPPLRGLGSPWR